MHKRKNEYLMDFRKVYLYGLFSKSTFKEIKNKRSFQEILKGI